MKKAAILCWNFFILSLCFGVLQESAWGKTRDLVFLAFGDSITYGVGSSSGGPETGYPLLLEQKLESAYPGNFISINAGLGGEVTSNAVARFKTTLDASKPDLVLLMEGTNDLNMGYSFDNIENNLRSMVLYALNQGKKVIIGTIAPVAYSPLEQANIAAFNSRIHNIAADYNIPVARVFESITSVQGWETSLIDPKTLNHPNDAGYQVIRDAFFNEVSSLIQSDLLRTGNPVGFSNFDGGAGQTVDILWRHAVSGQLYTWLMSNSGPFVSSQGSLGTVSSLYWIVKGTDDFNGDGRADILWRYAPTGQVYLWLIGPDGKSIIGEGSLGSVDSVDPTEEHNWKIQAVADFDNDLKADILWRHAITGELSLWQINGTTSVSKNLLGLIAPDWKIIEIADFNNDGKADILWRHAVTGQLYTWLMSGISAVAMGSPGTVSDLNWQIEQVADFDGDGQADILWRHALSGQVYLWLMNGITIASPRSLGLVSDLNWVIRDVADFDGDGKADILWRHALSGQLYTWLMDGLSVTSLGSLGTVSDLGWQIKKVTDFNGDGKADILWRHAVSGQVYLWLMDGITSPSQRSLDLVSDLNWEMK